jgi:hypothetical protein
MKLAAAALLLMLVATRSADAQVCAGATSFRDYPYQGGITAAFTDNAQGVGGTFAAGGESLFAGGGVAVLRYSDVDVRSTSISVFAGAELAADRRNRVFLCPVGQVGFGAGPDFGPVDISTFTLQGGANVGVIASESAALMVVPTFGLAALYQRVTADLNGAESSDSDTGGIANVGVGLIFNRNVGITPGISIPFAVGDSDVIFTIRLTFSFGG